MTFKPAGYGFYCNSGDMSNVPVLYRPRDETTDCCVPNSLSPWATAYIKLRDAFRESQRLYCEEITRQQAANLRKKRQLRGLRSGIRSQRNFIAALTR
jgi:hypothetical protein